jgi:SAM-dependent methyltransferase
MVHVQYGCGLSAPEGWINFDVSPTLRLQKIPVLGSMVPGPRFPKNARYGDIVSGLPVKDGSVDVAYCSHTLEHLSLEDCRKALRNTHRILKKGGVFRFVLPDLKYMAQQYVSSSSPDAAMYFVKNTWMGQELRPRGFSGFLRSWIGNAPHRWMWDYDSMAIELANAGFTSIRKASVGDGGDPMFTRIEDPLRWENCLGAHCVKG